MERKRSEGEGMEGRRGRGYGYTETIIFLLQRTPETSGKAQTADLMKQCPMEVQYYVLHIYRAIYNTTYTHTHTHTVTKRRYP